MDRWMLFASRWSLIMVYLVILAGSVVRMTGSGMGCPDWPKCFGFFIPPTHEDQLVWKAGTTYNKGQMILGDDELLVAREKFTTTEVFSPENWRVYDKHDYTIFNPVHTWIEYINRLLGALSGIPVMLLFVLATIRIRSDVVTWLLSAGALFALGFVAWLGKLVVDGNLIPHSITYHMFGAIALLLLVVAVLFRKSRRKQELQITDTRLLGVTSLVMLLTLAQVYLGTNVREQVDALLIAGPRKDVMDGLDAVFLIHRSFSIFLLLAYAWMLRMMMRSALPRNWFVVVVALLGVEIFAGVILNYAGFPAFAQPLHLLAALILVGVLFYLWLHVLAQTSVSKSAFSA
ncbi:MAG: heme A synthase [Cryomorphaceae bacterium]|nr:MAG: heme A synthase [Cryomorphaceae bacterium]